RPAPESGRGHVLRPWPGHLAGCCPARPCRRAPLTARGRRPGAGSSPLFEHLAGCELLAPAVEQIAKAQRLAARQLQASEQQRALTTSDFQPVLAGSDDLTGIALP